MILEDMCRAMQDAFRGVDPSQVREREIFIDNLLVRIQFIIVMIRWTGLAPWEFKSLFQVALHLPS
jgi:hypothetical protein